MGNDQAEDLKKIYDWTQPTIKLLSDLEHDFSELLQEWETFYSHNGDIGYFSGINSAIAPIKESFEELDDVRRRLVRLKKSSRESAADVSFAKVTL